MLNDVSREDNVERPPLEFLIYLEAAGDNLVAATPGDRGGTLAHFDSMGLKAMPNRAASVPIEETAIRATDVEEPQPVAGVEPADEVFDPPLVDPDFHPVCSRPAAFVIRLQVVGVVLRRVNTP